MAIKIAGTTVIEDSKNQPFASGTPTIVSTNTNLVAGGNYIVDTASLTLTLPGSPAAGNQIKVSVGGAITDTIIARNNNRIAGLEEDLTIDVGNSGFTFVYSDATNGWRIF